MAHVKRFQKDVAAAKAEIVSGPDAAISGTYLTKVINKYAAEHVWQNPQRAIGKRFKFGSADDTTNRWITIIGVADDIKREVLKIQKTLPAGVQISVVRDAGERVRNSVRNVEDALVQGAFAALLSRYSGEEDVVFGTTRAGRYSAGERAGSAVGLFINTLPVRARVSADVTVLHFLRALHHRPRRYRVLERGRCSPPSCRWAA